MTAKAKRNQWSASMAAEKTGTARGHMSYHAGLAAEDIVARHFEVQGGQIVERRWRGRAGEIDLILRGDDGVILVEVKQSRTFDSALAHVTPAQARRIYATGEEYLGTLPDGSLTNVRIDVALVDEQGTVRVIENAFGGDLW